MEGEYREGDAWDLWNGGSPLHRTAQAAIRSRDQKIAALERQVEAARKRFERIANGWLNEDGCRKVAREALAALAPQTGCPDCQHHASEHDEQGCMVAYTREESQCPCMRDRITFAPQAGEVGS